MISQQPNGYYTRISSIIDAPTHTNMTENDLCLYLLNTRQYDYPNQDVEEWLEAYAVPFEEAKTYVQPTNLTKKEIDKWLKKVES